MRLIFNCESPAETLLPEHVSTSIQEWRTEAGRLIAQGYSIGGYFWLHWPDYATFRFDASDSVIIFPLPTTDPTIITDLFYRSVYPLILQSRGIEVLHASAVMTSRGIIAFCADSGTGKSTLAYSLSRRGYPMWSDDAVALKFCDKTPISFSLPFSPRLLPDAQAFFQTDTGEIYPKGRSPHTLWKDEDFYEILAICLLHRSEGVDIRFSPIKPANAFPRLLAQAYYYQMPDSQHKFTMMEHYLDISNHIPIYQLDFPSGFQHVDQVLDQLEKFIESLENQS